MKKEHKYLVVSEIIPIFADAILEKMGVMRICEGGVSFLRKRQ